MNLHYGIRISELPVQRAQGGREMPIEKKLPLPGEELLIIQAKAAQGKTVALSVLDRSMRSYREQVYATLGQKYAEPL